MLGGEEFPRIKFSGHSGNPDAAGTGFEAFYVALTIGEGYVYSMLSGDTAVGVQLFIKLREDKILFRRKVSNTWTSWVTVK